MIRITREAGDADPRSWTLTLHDLPLLVGRSSRARVQLHEDGVWDEHAELRLELGRGLVARSIGDALLVVNGQAVSEARLRAGDLVDLGGARLRLDLAATRQRTFRLRESATWLAIGLLCLGQLILVHWVLP